MYSPKSPTSSPTTAPASSSNSVSTLSSPNIDGSNNVYANVQVGSSSSLVSITVTGSVRWLATHPKDIVVSYINPAIFNSNVYATALLSAGGSSYKGALYSLSALTGAYKSVVYIPNAIYTSPLISNNGRIFIVNKWRVYCYDLNLKLNFLVALNQSVVSLTSPEVYASPVMGPDGTVYVATLENYLCAFSATSGGAFTRPIRVPATFDSSPAIDADSSLYVHANDGFLYSFTKTGSVRWTFRTGNSNANFVTSPLHTRYSPSPVLGSSNNLYVASSTGVLYMLSSFVAPTSEPTTLGGPGVSSNASTDVAGLSQSLAIAIFVISGIIAVLLVLLFIRFLDYRKNSINYEFNKDGIDELPFDLWARSSVETAEKAEARKSTYDRTSNAKRASIKEDPEAGTAATVTGASTSSKSGSSANESEKHSLSDPLVAPDVFPLPSILRGTLIAKLLGKGSSDEPSSPTSFMRFSTATESRAKGEGGSISFSAAAATNRQIAMAAKKTMPPPAPPKRTVAFKSPTAKAWNNINEEHKILWSEIVAHETNPNFAVLGPSSNGIVFKALWRPESMAEHPNYNSLLNGIPVAIKVISKSIGKNAVSANKGIVTISDKELLHLFELAYEEVKTSLRIEQCTGSDQAIAKYYGITAGALPPSVSSLLNLTTTDPFYFGVVMRLEAGGSLEYLMHTRLRRKEVPTVSKLRLLADMARSLATIHASGETHGEVHLENALVRELIPIDNAPILKPSPSPNGVGNSFVALKDYGLGRIKYKSEFSKKMSGVVSSLSPFGSSRIPPKFRHVRVYSAPEMLVNPFDTSELVISANQKCDIYSFSLVCWELLCQTKPYLTISTEAMLASRVHQGFRPDLIKLPDDTPEDVGHMILCCWEKNPAIRKTAYECFAILQNSYLLMAKSRPEVYFSSPPNRPLASSHDSLMNYLYFYLSNRGYNVQWDRYYPDEDVDNRIKEKKVNECIALCAFVNSAYNFDRSARIDLDNYVHQHLQKLNAIILEDGFFSSDNADLLALLSYVPSTPLGEGGNQHLVDLGPLTRLADWAEESSPSVATCDLIHVQMREVLKGFNQRGCMGRSFSVRTFS